MERMLTGSDLHDLEDDDVGVVGHDDLRSRPEDFELVSRIGSGSFGTVFKVRRIQDGGIYVIKNVRISELTKKEQMEAINEVDILAKMDSPYVVKYFDSFIAHSCLQIVMEYCNKGDLQKMIKRAQKKEMSSLGEKSTWNIIIQILLGMHYLHDHKVLHRDMKSANVFLLKDPAQDFYCVKIGDLGVAKVLDSSTAFAQSIVGTPYYLSPELCADLPYRDKSDVWALGVIVYECCMLTHPFDARNQCALIMKIVQAQMAPVQSHVAPELKELIMWILQKDPKLRPKVKEILCDKTVREMMYEHGFSLPESLENAVVTERIQTALHGAAGASKGGKRAGPLGANTKPNTTVTRTSTGCGGVTTSTAPRPPAKRPVNGGGSSGEVRGGRVRGRADAKVSSSKARERHQVKQTVPRSREEGTATGLGQAMDIKDEGGDWSGEEGRVDWGEAKRILDEIADNDDKGASTVPTLQAKEVPPQDKGEDEGEYPYADDFEEYDTLEDEDESDSTGASATATSTLMGEGIRSYTERDSPGCASDGSVTLRIESKETDVSGSAAFSAISPSWKVRSVRSYANDETIVAGKDYESDEDAPPSDEYKSQLRQSLSRSKKLTQIEADLADPSLEDLAGGVDGEEDSVDGDSASLQLQDQDLWRSIWSQGRGVLCSNRHVDADYLEMEDEIARDMLPRDASSLSGAFTNSESKGVDDEGVDFEEDSKDMSPNDSAPELSLPRRDMEEALRTKHSRRAKILEGLIEDSRARNVAAIGEVVFTRVYELMSSMMYTPVGNQREDELSVSDKEKRELEELEKTLSERFNGNKGQMCDVVFNVKKLLAIESSLDRLNQSFMSTVGGGKK